MTILEVLKRVGEVIVTTGIIYGAIVGFVVAFGGRVPPWETWAQAQTLEQSIKTFQADQAKHDHEIQDNIDLLTLERLRDDSKAADLKATLHPRDPGAQADKWFAQKRLEIFFRAHPSLARAMGGVNG